MIEITTAVVEKVQTLMHDNAGFIMAKNVERILDDLARQAEIFGAAKTSIPVTMKMTVEVDDCGVHLTFDSVTWQKTLRATDKACYTVDYDPRQPNLPGFDDRQEKPPVIDVKALPAHESPIKTFLQGYMELADNCRRNLENASDATAMMIVAPSEKDHKVLIYEGGVWSDREVPNVEEALAASDDGEHIVFTMDRVMSKESIDSLIGKGFSLFKIVYEEQPAEWQYWMADDEGVFEMVRGCADQDGQGRRSLAERLIDYTEDDSLLAVSMKMNDL